MLVAIDASHEIVGFCLLIRRAMAVVIIHDFAERAVGGDEIETLVVGVGLHYLVSHTGGETGMGEQTVVGLEHGKDGVGLGFYQAVCRKQEALKLFITATRHCEKDGRETEKGKEVETGETGSGHHGLRR